MIFVLENKVSEDFCKKYIYFYKYLKWLQQDAKVTNDKNDKNILSKIRKSCYVRLFPEYFWEETSHIYTLIHDQVINLYNIELWPKLEDMREDIKIIKYIKGDYFDWHYDSFHESTKTRKINFSIQLSDENEYEGGDLEFFKIDLHKQHKKKGTIVLYPSFLPHRIKEVTKGTRYAIVGHLNGPQFR